MVSRLKTLTAEYRDLKARLEQGGGPDKVKRQHDQKKLTARERVRRLLDESAPWLEVGLLVAYDQYDGQAPAAGVVTGVGRVHPPPLAWASTHTTAHARHLCPP